MKIDSDQTLQPAKEKPVAAPENPDEIPQAKEPSLAAFLKTGFEPVGKVLYVWGGGWNEDDSAAGPEGVHIGMPESWNAFFEANKSGYNYNDFPYYIHDGLDCSGFLGWTLYNTLETEDGREGYVVNARNSGSFLSGKGWGTIKKPWEIEDYLPGDIMFNDGHVYIVLGQYEDGSLLIMHSSPPGVQINGTPDLQGNTQSTARQQAREIMERKAPGYFDSMNNAAVDYSYLNSYSQFRWNNTLFPDVENIQSMNPDEIINLLFS